MIEIHSENGKIGEASLKGGTVTASTPAVQDIADHMLRKHGTPHKAFRAIAEMNNGYVWAQTPDTAQMHAATWDQLGAEVELATVLDFYNPAGNPGQARIPTGQPQAGQFTKGQSQQQAKGKPDAHQQHLAHVAHVQHNAKTKSGLLSTAKNDRAKASALIKQRAALQAQLASASGKTSSGQSGSTTSANAATASSAPAATASTASSTPASTASSTSSTTASSSASSASASQLTSQIAQLNTQINSLLQSAAQAQAQAAKL